MNDRMRKPRQTIFFPGGWSLDYFMHPLQSVAKLLEHIHDAGGDAEQDDVQQIEDWRLQVSTFADELITPLIIKPSSTSNVIFEIELGNIPVGYRKEIPDQPTLQLILESAWDVAADCTIGTDWMLEWNAKQLIIRPWLEGHEEDQIIIRCTKSP